MDQVDVKVSKSVTTAHVVRVPCSFSPTGIHYLSIMVGDKQAVEGEHHKLVTRPHIMYSSSECMKYVPEDNLEGMMLLARETAPVKDVHQCYSILHRFRECVLMPSGPLREVREAAKIARMDLPLQLRYIAAYLWGSKREHDPLVKHRQKTVLIQDRLTLRIKQILNEAVNARDKRDRLRNLFEVGGDGYGIGVANGRGQILARRINGCWWLPEDWQTAESSLRWARYVDGGPVRRYCAVCEKDYGGDNIRYTKGHDAFSSTFHHTQVLRKLKKGLAATGEGLLKVEKIDRVPRTLSKYSRIKLVSRERWNELFPRYRE